MDPEKLKELQNRFLVPTYAPELSFQYGKGIHLWDASGRRYLDFTAGIGVCNLGHCHPVVTEAIQKQAATLVHVSNLYMNEKQPQLAEVIAGRTFSGRLFFANSGAEANEGMIKFARRWGSTRGKYEVICMNNSFHGRTLATLAATDKPKFREGFEPHMDGFKFVPFNDAQALEDAVTDKTAAILLEPIQGEGGVHPATNEFITRARQVCNAKQLLLLFDEVQCGIGRTGYYLAYQHYGVTPDAVSMAKGLGNGFPIGAFEVDSKWGDVLGQGSHASTFGGTPLACSAALAVFEVIEQEGILSNCQKMGAHLKAGLVQLSRKHTCIRDIRGRGLMIGVEFDCPVLEFVKKSAAAALLILSAGENVIRLLPPLTVTARDIDEALKILDDVIEEHK